MDFGVGVISAVDSGKVAQRAEALAAEKTSRIRLGTGVLVPTNRIAPVAAAAIASLSRLAPGRIADLRERLPIVQARRRRRC